jgi:hypothetical protein
VQTGTDDAAKSCRPGRIRHCAGRGPAMRSGISSARADSIVQRPVSAPVSTGSRRQQLRGPLIRPVERPTFSSLCSDSPRNRIAGRGVSLRIRTTEGDRFQCRCPRPRFAGAT